MEKIKLLVIFGGESNEHEISCLSAASVLGAIDKTKYDITILGITKSGRWMITEFSLQDIADGSWENNKNNIAATINLINDEKGLYTVNGDTVPIECVFPIMHGKKGEDGSLQGLLEIAGMPYVGPRVMASANCMDKVTAKSIVEQIGVKQARYYATDRYAFASNPLKELKEINKKVGGLYPVFVKPANSGSSVGITKAYNEKDLFEGIKLAAEVDHRIVIEENIMGREIEVAILGNKDPKASPIGEIDSSNEVYDYEAKYLSGESKTSIVEDLELEIQEDIKRKAVEIYKAFDCRGLSRVDFFYSDDGEVVFNEINTLPGFTNISMFPKLWEVAGIGYTELIDRLINLAMEEW